jgi:hypothetical protein
MIYQRILTDLRQKLLLINLLKPTGYETHQQVQHSTIVRSARNVFVLYLSENEQRLLPHTTEIDWIL